MWIREEAPTSIASIILANQGAPNCAISYLICSSYDHCSMYRVISGLWLLPLGRDSKFPECGVRGISTLGTVRYAGSGELVTRYPASVSRLCTRPRLVRRRWRSLLTHFSLVSTPASINQKVCHRLRFSAPDLASGHYWQLYWTISDIPLPRW